MAFGHGLCVSSTSTTQSKKSSKGSEDLSGVKLVPGWDRKPSDPE